MFFTWNTINQQKEEEEEDTDNYNTKKKPKKLKEEREQWKPAKSFHFIFPSTLNKPFS